MNLHATTFCILLMTQAYFGVCQISFGQGENDLGLSRDELQEIRIRELCDRLGLRYGDALRKYKQRKRNQRHKRVFLKSGRHFGLKNLKLDENMFGAIKEDIFKRKKQTSVVRKRNIFPKITRSERKIKLNFGKLASMLKFQSKEKTEKNVIKKNTKSRIPMKKHKPIRPRKIRKKNGSRRRLKTKKKILIPKKGKTSVTRKAKKTVRVNKAIKVKVVKKSKNLPKVGRIKLNFNLLSNLLESSRTKQKTKRVDIKSSSKGIRNSKSKDSFLNQREKAKSRDSFKASTRKRKQKQENTMGEPISFTSAPPTTTTSTRMHMTMPTTLPTEELAAVGVNAVFPRTGDDIISENSAKAFDSSARTTSQNSNSDQTDQSLPGNPQTHDIMGTADKPLELDNIPSIEDRTRRIINTAGNSLIQSVSENNSRGNRLDSTRINQQDGGSRNPTNQRQIPARSTLPDSIQRTANEMILETLSSGGDIQRLENEILSKLRETPAFMRATRENSPEADAKLKEVLDELITNAGSQLPANTNPTINPTMTTNPGVSATESRQTTQMQQSGSTTPNQDNTNRGSFLSEQQLPEGQILLTTGNPTSNTNPTSQPNTDIPSGAGQSDWMFIENELNNIFA